MGEQSTSACLPQSQPVVAGGNDEVPHEVERHASHEVVMRHRCDRNLLTGCGVPESNGLIFVARDDITTVAADVEALHHSPVVCAHRLAAGLAGIGVPLTQGAVITADDDTTTVGTECHAMDRARRRRPWR